MILWRSFFLIGLSGWFFGCQEPKPSMTGRLNAPSTIVRIQGCAQSNPNCDLSTEARPLLLISDSLGDELRMFDVKDRSFFSAPNPLFPLSIPVGQRPVAMAVDPFDEFAFVANAQSADISMVSLAPTKLVELDADQDSTTCSGRLGKISDRCRIGISRVDLPGAEWAQPESVAVPRGISTEGGALWDRAQPLPVYVSLAGTGQVGVIHFQYPMTEAPFWAQRLDWVEAFDVGGIPAGLAVTKDGRLLYVADEGANSIVEVNTAQRSWRRIEVGGFSHRLALTPDESVLYVILSEQSEIVLVDVASGTVMQANSPRPQAMDPESTNGKIRLPAIARDITFVKGVALPVFDEKGNSRSYTSELLTADELTAAQVQDPNFTENIVKTFAYVSNMNGNVYLVDAENHRTVDLHPFSGASSSIPVLNINGVQISDTELAACVEDSNCWFPNLAEYDKVYGENDETRPIYHGIHVNPGITKSEGWVFTWEGSLPGVGNSTTGRFSGWRLEDDLIGLNFLDAGAIPGDTLEIWSGPSWSGSGENPCRPGSGAAEQTDIRNEFEITLVEKNFIQLKPIEGMNPATCWAEALWYTVRAKGAWTVAQTSETGLVGRLYMVPRQIPPPTVPAYDNGFIALTMFAPGVDADGQPITIPRDSNWGFNTDSGFSLAQFAPEIRAGASSSMVSVDLDPSPDVGNPGDDRVFLLFKASNAMMEFFPSQFDPSNYILYQ